MEKLLSVGKILNFHGIQGEVKVGYTAGKEEQLTKIRKVFAVIGSKTIPLTVESIRFHKQFALIKFREISSVNEAIEIKGAYLKIHKNTLETKLEKNEFYIDDLVGLEVFDQEQNLIGKVSQVVNIRGEDLLVIKNSENQEYMIPFVQELVPEVDVKACRVILKKIPGLIEEAGE